jgi:hypothetical protein
MSSHTLTHKTHHDLYLRETTTFPFIVLFVIRYGGYTQMVFFQGLQVGIPEIRIPAILDAHNFLCRLPIEVRPKTKLNSLLRTLQ